MDIGLGGRIFNFVIDVITFSRTLGYNIENKIMINQLLKSVTSIGANYEESQGAVLKADFRYKIKISLKEARETHYWLRIIKTISDIDLENLINETDQLKKILGKIGSSSRT